MGERRTRVHAKFPCLAQPSILINVHPISDLRFACDAMLGGLARWLRAAGYDASWQMKIGDRDLIHQADREGRTLLTSDTDIFNFAVVRDGKISALFVPHGLDVPDQLAFVMRKLSLDIRTPRCMACGGALVEIPKKQARDRVPPRSFAWLDHFWECNGCRQVFWRGTHWQRISDELNRIVGCSRTSA